MLIARIVPIHLSLFYVERFSKNKTNDGICHLVASLLLHKVLIYSQIPNFSPS